MTLSSSTATLDCNRGRRRPVRLVHAEASSEVAAGEANFRSGETKVLECS